MKKHFLLIALWCSALYSNAQTPFEFPFCPLDTNFTTQQIVIPGGPLKYDVLCTEDSTGYLVTTDAFAKLKNNFQSTFFLFDNPQSNTEGTLYVSQNINVKSIALGDGGGVIQMKVKRNESGSWVPVAQTVNGKQAYYRMVDFSPVGGSVYQKSLIYRSPRIVVTEESMISGSNTELSAGFSDVSDYTIPTGNGTSPSRQVIPRHQNMGWVVDIDPTNVNASRKWYGYGRGFYTDILDLGNNRTLLVTGTEPSVILKTEVLGSITKRDFKIYCYRQNAGGVGGEWILLNELDIDDQPVILPMEDLVNIHKKALEAGATMFNNLSKVAVLKVPDPAIPTGRIEKIYITETGSDNSGDLFSNPSKKYNGTLAHHLQKLDAEDGATDGVMSDPYGRILELDFATLNISSFIEGGPADNCRFHFSNPDGIGLHTITDNNSNTKYYLVIHENVAGVDKYRNPDHVGAKENRINETYVFDLSSMPSRDNLKLFAIGPKGAEITGFSRAWAGGNVQDDGNTVFVTLKYPNPENQAPFNKSMVLAISGLFDYFQNPTDCDVIANDCQPIPSSVNPQYTDGIGANTFKAWPNPVRRILHLNETTNVSVYDYSGKLVLTRDDSNEVDLIGFKPGVYFIKNEEGQSIKLIVE